MFIVYIAFGITSGLIAATVALFSGTGFLMALAAYVLAGMAGMIAGLIWTSIPKQGRTAKQIVTQRS